MVSKRRMMDKEEPIKAEIILYQTKTAMFLSKFVILMTLFGSHKRR